MAKVVKPQESFIQTVYHSTGNNGAVSVGTNKPRLGLLRAPKRNISQYRRCNNRTRRVQRCESSETSKSLSTVKENVQSSTISLPQNNGNKGSNTPESLVNEQVGYVLSDYKRPRPEHVVQSSDNLGDHPSSAPADNFVHRRCSPSFDTPRFSLNRNCDSRLFCQLSSINMDHLHDLLSREFQYHPNNAFLYYVNPQVDDKVDAALRNEAVHNLRFMHNAFFNLSTNTFCKAVNLIDRFIVKVKVKPKYMACVATASYCAACKLDSANIKDAELPDPETLVRITRCGGNAADLLRMEEILASKLSHDMDGVNAFDFLQLFIDCIMKFSNRPYNSDGKNEANASKDYPLHITESGDFVKESKKSHDSKPEIQGIVLHKRLGTLMEIALCSLEVYRFRPVCLALGILAQIGVEGLISIADVCGVDWFDVCDCANLVGQLYEIYYRDPLPRSRKQPGLFLSRRICRIGYSSPTPLDTISEDYEPVDDDEWLLPLLFEP